MATMDALQQNGLRRSPKAVPSPRLLGRCIGNRLNLRKAIRERETAMGIAPLRADAGHSRAQRFASLSCNMPTEFYPKSTN